MLISQFVCIFSCTGFFWSNGSAGAEHVFEGMWWTDWHPPRGGATGTARHCPQAAQTVEGQRSTCLNTRTNYCTPQEAHFIILNGWTFGFYIVSLQLTCTSSPATLSVFTFSLSSGFLVSDSFGNGTIRNWKSWIIYGESLPFFCV